EPVVTESEPALEALSDITEPDAESVGPSLPELEVTEVESEAPADVASTHGPDAVAVADAEGEVDLDTVAPQRAAEEDETDGVLVAGRDAPGRGAYTCRSLACFERAAARRTFARILRHEVRIGPELQRLYTGESHG